MEHEYVLATLTPWPSIYGYYPSPEAAAAKADEANAYAKHKAETQRVPLEHYTPMMQADYKQAEREFYLSQPLRETTAEQYQKTLDTVPPRYFGTHTGVMSFVMGEYWSKPYTNQYVSCDGRFFVRPVDALDQSTWITRDEIDAHLHGLPQPAWQQRVEESKRSIEPSR